MRFCSLLFSSLLLVPTDSVYVEDAGVLDFAIATAGHGTTRWVKPYKDQVITTGGPSSCHVASRHIETGALTWRRNMCASKSSSGKVVHASGDFLYTMEQSGIVRAWTLDQGNLLWDNQVASTSEPRIWALDNLSQVAVASNETLVLFESRSGHQFDTINAVAALESTPSKLKTGEVAQFLAIFPGESNVFNGVLAFVQSDGTTTGNRMMLVEMELGNDQFRSVQVLSFLKTQILASSLQIQSTRSGYQAVTVTSDSLNLVHFSLDSTQVSAVVSASLWNPKWTQVLSVSSTSTPSIISVKGADSESNQSMSLFRLDESLMRGWERLYGSEESDDTQHYAISYCPEAELVVSMTTESLRVYRHDSLSLDGEGSRHMRLSPLTPLPTVGDLFVPDGDNVEIFSVVGCTKDAVTTVLSTSRGTTTQLTFVVGNNEITSKIGWTAEEGLASVSSALLLDASHLGADDLVEEKDVVQRKLSLSSRLSSQWETLVSKVKGGDEGSSLRDHIFGFVKVAAMLSQSAHRMWGMNTSGDHRGSIRWSVDLPKTADWHAMVHGTTNAVKAVHGINGGTHSREILVLSVAPTSVGWKCIDGTNGAVHSQQTVDISSPIAQVIPMYGSTGGCRQASLLLHEDLSLSVVPADQDTLDLVGQQLKNTPNGLYTHLIDRAGSKVESYQVVQESGRLVPRQVGRTVFSDEHIVKVAYPMRDEVVQSLCTVLGDESLLLKYVNPHLAVLVTILNDENASTGKLFSSIKSKQDTKKPRKPAGAGEAASAVDLPSDEDVPNMFINLVDTVSGRVLHRASHANADPTLETSVLVSENWIFYSFVNAKTRRTEIGVLTLHEGMIDSKGLTLFSSPAQTTTFSSFDTRESKPVVLAKTYTFPKAITALGATATWGGISSRKILIASDDGKITAVDQKMLETRRPLGEVKDAEKKEGLFPYRELIPEISLFALNYNRTTESVRSVVSSPTALESQSLILAFGGPDLFFVRTSPSKGFDLLPHSFSRMLVSFVSVGLVIVVFVVKRMGNNKAVKLAWQ